MATSDKRQEDYLIEVLFSGFYSKYDLVHRPSFKLLVLTGSFWDDPRGESDLNEDIQYDVYWYVGRSVGQMELLRVKYIIFSITKLTSSLWICNASNNYTWLR